MNSYIKSLTLSLTHMKLYATDVLQSTHGIASRPVGIRHEPSGAGVSRLRLPMPCGSVREHGNSES